MDQRLPETHPPDYRQDRITGGITLMRHALADSLALARPVAALALGVVAPAVCATLVLRSRRPQTYPASLRRTLLAAIALAAVTIRT
jgi:hypothetical protein